MNPDVYNSPYVERWCRGSPLLRLFSQRNKLWRQLWIWLAESERELGLDKLITAEMVAELKAQKLNIDWDRVRELERQLKHDVMAHIHAYGMVCPTAKGIIHLGATSCFVQDNADLIVQRQALQHLCERLAICLDRLANFTDKYAGTPCVGRTHFQPASMTTVGKRAAVWADGLLDAFRAISQMHSELRFLGMKGAVGTRDATIHLFDGDKNKARQLDEEVARKAGFDRTFKITTQTYPRNQDSKVLFALSSLASAAIRFANDLRILQMVGEMSEPFSSEQVGSSAMPYKRNPILCERICGIARALMISSQNPLFTYADQGFERTLDDSANRRIVLPDAFLAADAILSTLQNVFEGMKLHEEVVAENTRCSDAPLERALMMLTMQGADRQEAHERIRQIALNRHERHEGVQQQKGGVLLDDAVLNALPEIRAELAQIRDSLILLCGDAEEQTREFLSDDLRPAIDPLLATLKDAGKKEVLQV